MSLRDLIANVPVAPGSDTDRLLKYLADGKPRTEAEIRQACGGMIVHSRTAGLRKKLPAFGLELPLARREKTSEGPVWLYQLRPLNEEGGLPCGPVEPSSLSGSEPWPVDPRPAPTLPSAGSSSGRPAAQLVLDLRQEAA